MRKIIITGGAGFVGSNLAILFKHANSSNKIITLDNLYRRGSELTLKRLRDHEVNFVHGDIRIIEDIERAGDFDLLIECSAEPSVLAGYSDSPVYLNQTNLLGTINCLEMCRRRQSDIVFLSTSRVYPMTLINKLNYNEGQTRLKLVDKQHFHGVSKHGFSEDFPLKGVRSLYGATKLCSELMLQEYIVAYGIKGIINRCGVLTGPWQMGKVDQGFFVLWMARHLWQGELAYIGYGGQGKQVRDVLHIKDLFDLLTIQIEQIEKLNGEVFNVGGGCEKSVSLAELTHICQEITGRKINITSIPETRDADIPYYVSDIRKINKISKWAPQRNVKKIAADIFQWLKKHETMLKPILG